MGLGLNAKTTVSSIQVFKQEQVQAQAGDNVGLNIKQIKMKQLKKGMILAKQGSFQPTNHFEVIWQQKKWFHLKIKRHWSTQGQFYSTKSGSPHHVEGLVDLQKKLLVLDTPEHVASGQLSCAAIVAMLEKIYRSDTLSLLYMYMVAQYHVLP
jgi:selenocysteine-specific translation elongation factor